MVSLSGIVMEYNLKTATALVVLTILALLSDTADCQVVFSDAAVLGQGGSSVAVPDGYSALIGNPAGFRVGDGEWILGRTTVQMAVKAADWIGGGSDALLDQTREAGFSAGLGLGFGFVGRGLGLGLLTGTEAAFVPSADQVAGSVDTTVALVGGYSYPVRLGRADLAVGGALRPMMRFHTPLDDPGSLDFVRSLAQADGFFGSLRGSDTYYGVAVGFDLGLLATAGPFSIGVSARDVGGTRFLYSKSDWATLMDSILSLRGLPEGSLTDETLEIPMVLTAGIAVEPFEGFSGHTEIRDLQSLFGGDIGFLEALHVGVASAAWSRIEVRGGLAGGRPTLGAGLNLGRFELDIAFAGRSWLSADNWEEVPVLALSAGFVREPRSREIR